MLTVAYLANQFPSAVEPYVIEEIEELRSRGVRVVAGSVRKPIAEQSLLVKFAPEVVLQSATIITLLRALWLCARQWKGIAPLVARVLFRGGEGPRKRLKALAHTWLGACYAVLLGDRAIDHIHVHHGYFGSWIAMVAARLLGVEFSMTLHGSDLLLHGTYLDAKLENCAFCLTVSEYNRRFILQSHPEVDSKKVIVARLGVEVSKQAALAAPRTRTSRDPFTILTVGRLHPVKDHAFLVRACSQLRDDEVHFNCWIAGDGPERRRLQALIRRADLDGRVELLGHVPRTQMDSLYDWADLVVITSRSEGIPLVLMEAMARGKIVLAPAITGIPELVIPENTGFLYEPGSLHDFVDRVLLIRSLLQARDRSEVRPCILSAARQLGWIRHAAQLHVWRNFNRRRNLESFGDVFVQRIATQTGSITDENLVLQQI